MAFSLRRTAAAEMMSINLVIGTKSESPIRDGGYPPSAFRLPLSAFCLPVFRLPLSAFRFLPSAFRFPLSAFRLPPSAFRLLPSAFQRPRGFSLLELIVVLLIISIAGAVVMPSMRTGLSGMRLEAKGRDLATLCRSARIQAVGQQSVYRVAIERDKNRIFLADAFHEKVRDFDLTDEIQIDSVKFEGNEDHEQVLYISFYPNGRADEAEVWLKNEKGRRVMVQIELLTGTARLILPKDQR